MFDNWYNTVIGQPIDVDKYYGDQCVDLAMSWAEWVFQQKWWNLIGYGDARQLFDNSNPNYYDKIPYTGGVIPVQGDMGILSGTPGNPEGHIFVIIRADANGMTVIEQNGYNPTGVAYVTTRKYTSNLRGFIRPKGVSMNPIVQNADEAAELFRGVFKREPSQDEINSMIGRYWKERIVYLRTSEAGQGVQAKVNGYDALAHENAVQAQRIKDLEAQVATGGDGTVLNKGKYKVL